MIIEHRGDLLSLERGVLVHGCNAQGVMGSGIAKQIRDAYPKAYEVYRREHEQAGLKVGDVIPHWVNGDLIIANAITQDRYGRDPNTVYVSYDGVRQCFRKIARLAQAMNLPVHFPLIGCGLANGRWSIVSAIIEEEVPDPIEKHLWVYEPTTVSS